MGLLDRITGATKRIIEPYGQVASDVIAAVRRGGVPDPRFTPRLRPESFVQVQEAEIEAEWGWTLEGVQAAIQSMSLGDFSAGQRLMMAMMRDPIVAHGVETRCEMLTQIEHKWQRPTECPEPVFEEWVQNWPDCLPASDHQQLGEYRCVLGAGLTNSTWQPSASGRLWLPRLHLREPCNMTWRSDPAERRYYFTSLDGYYPIDSDGQRWLLFQRAGRRPHLAGALLPLAVAWFTKQEAFRGWPSHNRSHVKPQRLLKVPSDQRESDDVRRLVAQAQSLLAGGVLIMPQYKEGLPNFDFDLVEAKADTYKTFADLIQLCDNYITLVLLGALENTQGSSASNAKAQTQDKVTLRKVKADAKSSAEAELTLARCFVKMNKLPPRAAPIPIYEADPPEDQNDLAKRQQQRALAGQELGGFIGAMDAHNDKRVAASKPPIDFEADYLAEQIGLQMKRSQDGYQSRPM